MEEFEITNLLLNKISIINLSLPNTSHVKLISVIDETYTINLSLVNEQPILPVKLFVITEETNVSSTQSMKILTHQKKISDIIVEIAKIIDFDMFDQIISIQIDQANPANLVDPVNLVGLF